MTKRNETHRVIQVMEANEEQCIFEGSEDECYDWLDENAESFEESTFYVEGIE